MRMKLYFVLLVILAGCSFKKNPLENQVQKGHEELYSEPSAPKLAKLDDEEKRIVIAATNDVQGHYQAHNITFDDETKKKQTISIGGIDTIQNYFKILREVYPNLVLLDSGDIFARASSSNTVKDFYSTLRYDGMTLGLGDFNLKLPSNVPSSAEFFQNFAKTSPVPLLLSNLYELKTARAVEWQGTKPYLLKEMDGVKVGVIGLIADDIVEKTPVNNRVGLFVENMLQATLRYSRLLRSLGADVIVVLAHQGIDCGKDISQKLKLPLSKVNFEPKNEAACNLSSPLGQYLARLPHQLVDLVIGGRTHQKMANFVNGTLVLGSFEEGKSFSYAELVVNTTRKKIVPEKTVVHQPVLFCQEFFKETKDCYSEDPSVNHASRIPAKFLGQEIPAIKKTVSFQEQGQGATLDIFKALNTFKADIAYIPETSGGSQLFIAGIKGAELLRILELDYNSNRGKEWSPSPFVEKNKELSVTIAGLDLVSDQTYRVLTDLEALQRHPTLSRQMANKGSESLQNFSWDTLKTEDSISTVVAAPSR
jgi:2',3'-cyclic-nucleotide 2'-phosphodiesterase (5'-nucleotidase family)